MVSHLIVMVTILLYHSLLIVVYGNLRENLEKILGVTILMGVMLSFSLHNNRYDLRMVKQLGKNRIVDEVLKSFSLITLKEIGKQTMSIQLCLLLLLFRGSIQCYLILITHFAIHNVKTIVLAE